MALDIQSSSTSSSSSSSTRSTNLRNSGSDLFSQNLAAAASSAQRSAESRAAAAANKQSAQAPKHSYTAQPASSSQPKPTADSQDSDHRSSSSAADRSSAADHPKSSAKPKASSAAQAAADAQSGQDGSAPDDASAAANTEAGANAAAKGRAAPRTPAKTGAAQNAAANTAGDAIDDPSADTSNQSGMSLLQLLAQSLKGDDTVAPSTDSTTPATTDKPAANGTDSSSTDPSAMALAMFTQALAAALGASAATRQTPVANAPSATASDAMAGITNALGSSNGSASMQDLMSVLAQNVVADAKGKSDGVASQLSVDLTKGGANDATASDTAAAGLNSLAHLGVASHFSAHMGTDANTGDLESPVGSSAWNDELGTQLTWMSQKGLETGSLRVTPEHLGPVEVKISVQNGDASVWFGATHPDTRAALEQALPRLREMFASQGMNLTDSGVSRDSPRSQTRSQASQSISGVSAVGSSDVGTAAAARMSLGLVDTYA